MHNIKYVLYILVCIRFVLVCSHEEFILILGLQAKLRLSKLDSICHSDVDKASTFSVSGV